jgi:hypothetical protein
MVGFRRALFGVGTRCTCRPRVDTRAISGKNPVNEPAKPLRDAQTGGSLFAHNPLIFKGGKNNRKIITIFLAKAKRFGFITCMSNTNQRKADLETKLSSICGVAIEITVRNLTAFTISAEGNVTSAMEKAKAFLSLTGALSNWKNEYDEECDFTCAYFNLTA